MHPIFTQMYLTVSIGPSHMESPTELFIKKFFFPGSFHFSYLNLPTKIPKTGTCNFNGPPPSLIPRNNSSKHINPVVSNYFSQFQPSSVSYNSKPPQTGKQDLLSQQARFLIAAPTSNYNLFFKS